MKKIQILYIHGGHTPKTHRDYLDYLKNRPVSIEDKIKWSESYLKETLGDNFQIIRPKMPLKENAKYEEWKIHFERYFNQLNDNIILIGESLGAIFLAKYLSENIFPKKIISVYLIAPPFDNTLPGEDLVGGFELNSDLSMIEKNCNNIKLLFSKNDNVVSLSHAEKYRKKLEYAKIIIYEDKNGHFKISKFPEIIKMIKEDIKDYN